MTLSDQQKAELALNRAARNIDIGLNGLGGERLYSFVLVVFQTSKGPGDVSIVCNCPHASAVDALNSAGSISSQEWGSGIGFHSADEGWNFDITNIPRTGEQLWLAHPTDGKVYLTKFVQPTKLTPSGWWNGWKSKVEPIAWQPFVRPNYPSQIPEGKVK